MALWQVLPAKYFVFHTSEWSSLTISSVGPRASGCTLNYGVVEAWQGWRLRKEPHGEWGELGRSSAHPGHEDRLGRRGHIGIADMEQPVDIGSMSSVRGGAQNLSALS